MTEEFVRPKPPAPPSPISGRYERQPGGGILADLRDCIGGARDAGETALAGMLMLYLPLLAVICGPLWLLGQLGRWLFRDRSEEE